MNLPRAALLLTILLASVPAIAQHGPSTRAEPAAGPHRRRDPPATAGCGPGQRQRRDSAAGGEVTVRSLEPSSVVGQYRVHFAALDVNGDGFISREEAQANPALADEFNSLDRRHRGKLDRTDLAGWLVDWTEGIKSYVHKRLNPSVPASQNACTSGGHLPTAQQAATEPGSSASRRWRTGG